MSSGVPCQELWHSDAGPGEVAVSIELLPLGTLDSAPPMWRLVSCNRSARVHPLLLVVRGSPDERTDTEVD